MVQLGISIQLTYRYFIFYLLTLGGFFAKRQILAAMVARNKKTLPFQSHLYDKGTVKVFKYAIDTLSNVLQKTKTTIAQHKWHWRQENISNTTINQLC